jgi:hypothetical protein
MCQKNVLIERAQNFVRRGIQAEKALGEPHPELSVWSEYGKDQRLGYQSCYKTVSKPICCQQIECAIKYAPRTIHESRKNRLF